MSYVNYRLAGIAMLPSVVIGLGIAVLFKAPWMALASIALFGFGTAVVLIALGKRKKTSE